MLKQFYEFVLKQLSLTRDLQQVQAEMKEMRQEQRSIREQLRNLEAAVIQLAMELRHSRETEASEREKLALRLENEMLKKQLTAGRQVTEEPKEEDHGT